MELPTPIRDAIVGHARACLPEEACGLLAIDGAGHIREAYCLANAERSATAFTVDPDEHFRVLTEAEGRGWAIGGVFHSHPASAAVPSRTDVARSLEPGWLHVIVGRAASATPEVRAWRIEDGVPVEEPLTPDPR